MSLSHTADRTERRKIQNRINQRKYRRRQKTNFVGPAKPTCWKYIGSLSESDEADYFAPGVTPVMASHSGNLITMSKPGGDPQSPLQLRPIVCSFAPMGECERAAQFEIIAYQSYLMGSPTADHLLTLVKLNVYRALSENMTALGMDMGWMKADVSLHCTLRPIDFEWVIPPHLQPTAIQRSVSHHPWLDFFPHPKMRDRLISAGEGLDEEELCLDVMGFWDSNREYAGLIVWGQPWMIENWELSEGFIRKWNWTLRDCPELFKSTNYWRSVRGEKKITVG